MIVNRTTYNLMNKVYNIVKFQVIIKNRNNKNNKL